MDEINIRQLQRMSSSQIKDSLPFWITKDGDKVGMALSSGENEAIFQMSCALKGAGEWLQGRRDWPDRSVTPTLS